MKRLILLIFSLCLFATLEGQIIRANPFARAQVSGYTARSADYQAVYNAMPTKPSEANAIIDDDFYYSLDSLFTAESITLYYMLVPSVQYQDGALINWKSPGSDADDPTSCAWTQFEGYTGDGSADYISTNFNPNGVVAQDNASAAIYVRNNVQTDNALFGAAAGTTRFVFYPYTSGSLFTSRINTTADQNGSNTWSSSVAFWINTRRAADDIEIYRNGTGVDTESDASTGVPNAEFYIFRHTAAGFYSEYQFSIFFVMTGVTDDQASKINTIVERRMDRLGKGIE